MFCKVNISMPHYDGTTEGVVADIGGTFKYILALLIIQSF